MFVDWLHLGGWAFETWSLPRRQNGCSRHRNVELSSHQEDTSGNANYLCFYGVQVSILVTLTFWRGASLPPPSSRERWAHPARAESAFFVHCSRGCGDNSASANPSAEAVSTSKYNFSPHCCRYVSFIFGDRVAPGSLLPFTTDKQLFFMSASTLTVEQFSGKRVLRLEPRQERWRQGMANKHSIKWGACAWIRAYSVRLSEL